LIRDQRHLLARAKALVDADTTEMAPSVLEVPLTYYRDPEILERERELIATTPIAVVPSCKIPNRHDFAVRDVIGTSVLVTRDADGRAHAFLNYCRHRGARVAAGCGSAQRHACPYHAWTYDSAGALVRVPGAEGFAGVDRGDYGLVELPVEERHGFVWAVLTAGASLDVAAHLGPLDEEFSRFPFAKCEYLTEREIAGAVNWKAALEAFAENYHFPFVHSRSLVGQNTLGNTTLFDAFGPHHRLCFPNPWIKDAPAVDDYPTPIDFMVFIYWVYPNLVVAVTPVGVELIDILPGDDPGECTLRHGWMASTPAPDDATRAGYQELYELVHAAVRDEDFSLLPTCGDGIRHGRHDHMLIGRNEIGVQNVVRAFSDALQLGVTK
jgi:nitrite reductase/ring-hydroxylating ferredoxin subunit